MLGRIGWTRSGGHPASGLGGSLEEPVSSTKGNTTIPGAPAWAGADQHAVAAAVDGVVRRLEPISLAMVATYQQQIPAYRDLESPAALEEIRAASRTHALVALCRLAAGGQLTESELHDLADLGPQRLTWGIPLPALQDAYQIGIRIIVSEVLQELAAICAPEDYVRLSAAVNDRLLAITARISCAMTDAYLRAERHGLTAADAPSSRLDRFLSGAEKEPDEGLAEIFGSEPATFVVAAVSALTDGYADPFPLYRIRDAVHARIPRMIDHVTRTDEGRTLVLIAPAQRVRVEELQNIVEEAVRRLTRPEEARLIAGIGEAATGFEGIRSSYDGARRIVGLLRAHPRLPRIMCHRDALPLLVLAGDEDLRKTLLTTLEPLTDHNPTSTRRLLATLDAYFDSNANQGKAAARLGITPRALQYRLSHIEKLTGLRRENPNEMLRLLLGWAAHRLR